MRLDRRVAVLLRIGEEALKRQQTALAVSLGAKEFEICRLADELRTSGGRRKFAYPFTYGENFRLLFSTAAIAFAGMFVADLFQLLGCVRT
jgi:hypothetical protein